MCVVSQEHSDGPLAGRLLLARATWAGLSKEDAATVQAIANGAEVNLYMLRLAGEIGSRE